MPNRDQIDQFESVMRSATREVFRFAPPRVRSVLVVSDLDPDRAPGFMERCRDFLDVYAGLSEVTWSAAGADDYTTVADLLALVERASPDLIVTYRNLHTEGWRHPHTLGDHAEVLTQVARPPVLLMPHPEGEPEALGRLTNTDSVIAITDHLAGEHELVSWAATVTAPGGRLWLAHVEDQHVFERYIDAISKIQEISTDVARERIMERLLKEPTDYIESCTRGLAEAKLDIEVGAVVTVGHRVGEYKALIDSHAADLVVLHTKDDDQLAMHGMAYPLAVEMRATPMLML